MKIDEEKARDVFQTYSNYVFSTALLLTGSESLADNITQDSFIKIFRYFHTYDENKPFRPWIYKIVVNTARTALKNRSNRRTIRLDFEIVSDERDPMTSTVQDALMKLRKTNLRPFHLRMYGLTLTIKDREYRNQRSHVDLLGMSPNLRQ